MNRTRNAFNRAPLLVTSLVLLTAAAAIAQSRTQTQDPVTGKWGSDGLTYLDLKFDGKNGVSGVTIWRDGSGS